jgi:hypothetical protein
MNLTNSFAVCQTKAMFRVLRAFHTCGVLTKLSLVSWLAGQPMGHAVAAPPELLIPELVMQAAAGTSEAPAALSPEGGFLAVSSGSYTQIYETRSGQLRRVLRSGGWPVWSPDGKVLAVGGNGVRLSQMPAATLLRFEKRAGGGISFDASGRYFACATGFFGGKDGVEKGE